MKNLKRNTLSSIAFLFAFGAVFVLKGHNQVLEPPRFKENPFTGQRKNISERCTLTPQPFLCSQVCLSAVNGKYWTDPLKNTPIRGYDRTEVYTEWY